MCVCVCVCVFVVVVFKRVIVVQMGTEMKLKISGTVEFQDQLSIEQLH